MEVAGQYSGGGATPELFTVGELDPIWALADVHEIDMSRVHLGDQVTVTPVAYPERHMEGKIDWMAAALEPQTSTIRVRCVLSNPDRLLRPEMFATVAIRGRCQRTLAFPRNAVVHFGAQAMVYRELSPRPDGLLRYGRVPVTVDEDIPGDLVRVIGGLRPGDRVVASGALLLTTQ